MWIVLLYTWTLTPTSFWDGETNLCSGETPNGVLEAGEQCDDGNSEDLDGCSRLCRMELPNCDLVSENPQGSFISWNVTPTTIEAGSSVGFEFLFKTGFAGTLIEWGGYSEMGQLNPWAAESHLYEIPGNYYPKIWVKNIYDKGGNPFVVACDLSPITVSAKCGDGQIHDAEQCDDGNTEDGDGCSASCQEETPDCSFLESSSFTPTSWPQGTQVTATVVLSGNTPDWINLSSIDWWDSDSDSLSYDPHGTSITHIYNNDGQFIPTLTLKNTIGNTNLTVECPVTTTITIASECGNNQVEAGEQCDDGNTENGDGCSDACQWEVPSCSALTASFDPQNGKPGTVVQSTFSVNNPWVKITELNWWDGNNNQNPESPISHTYNTIGNYTPWFTLVNTSHPASSVYCPMSETIVISATCGNGEREGDEQCDGGAACAPDCTWKQPNAEVILQSFSVAPTVWTPGTKVTGTVTLKSWVADWITVKQIVWSDENSEDNPSLDALTHVYNTTGSFHPYLVVVNQEAVDHWASEASVRNSLYAENPVVIRDSACGNNAIETGEQCDDGNTTDGDGCSASCQWEKPDCSNLSLQLSPSGTYVPVEVQAKLSANSWFQLESLDRWNGTLISVGTSSTLKNTYTAHGKYMLTLLGKNILSWANITWSCQKELVLSQSTCGDKKIEHLEQCDDGNATDSDGCSASCQLEYVDCRQIQPDFKKSSEYAPSTISFSLSPLSGFRISSLEFGGKTKVATGSESLSWAFSGEYATAGSHTIKLQTVNLLSGAYAKECSYILTLNKKTSGWSGGGSGGGSSWGSGKWWFAYVASCGNGVKDGGESCDLWGVKTIASDGKLFTNTKEYNPKYKGYTCTSACKLEKQWEEKKTEEKKTIEEKKSESKIHNAPSVLQCEVKDTTKYPKDLLDAFAWAYQYKITTICPIEKANLDGALLRRHMAKMISEFAIQILGMKPDLKKTCKFADIADQTKEMKDYIKLSCQLWVMGYHADGKTKKKNFEPNKAMTKAQFATLLSRLLWESTFNNADGTSYWTEHIKALKNAEILESTAGSVKATQKRWEVFKILKNAYKYKTNQ